MFSPPATAVKPSGRRVRDIARTPWHHGEVPALLGDSFRFGVATAGYQVEGGFNGPGEPRNNWYEWEMQGRVEPSGLALDFWNEYERHLDKAAALGVDSIRLSVEWARCEPAEGAFDDDAFARYAAILAGCRERGMEPLVTLLHFTHPAWLGTDLWTRADAVERFAAWVTEAVRRLAPGCHQWVTLNELNTFALLTYFLGACPPGRYLDGPTMLKATDMLLSAHVAAYAAIKQLQSESVVGANLGSFSVYELDRLLTDLLLARSREVARDGLRAHLDERRASWYASEAARRALLGGGGVVVGIEHSLRRLCRMIDPVRSFSRTIEAVYTSPHERCLDVVQLDYYDPSTAAHLQLPFTPTAGGRSFQPMRPLWEDPPDPEGLMAQCAAKADAGLEVWIVENGLCNRVRRGRSYPRRDGWDRPRYLRENLGALLSAVSSGVPVTGYWHWSLADNYEWGSYEPRFGIYGVDRERGCRWQREDSMGEDSAGAYRRIIEGLRAGDACVLSSLESP